MEDQVVPHFVDPVCQSSPLAQERLVGDLDRNCPRRRVTIEGEQPVSTIGLEDPINGSPVNVGAVKTGSWNPAPRYLTVLSDAHHPQHHLPNCGAP